MLNNTTYLYMKVLIDVTKLVSQRERITKRFELFFRRPHSALPASRQHLGAFSSPYFYNEKLMNGTIFKYNKNQHNLWTN
jgi:hypothetical protein